MCVTDRHDMTLAVKVALNPITTNQPSQGCQKVSLCGNGLKTLEKEKTLVINILTLTKLKALNFADDEFNVAKMIISDFERVDNTGKKRKC